MKPVLHIGPSKSASTSIQAVIPHLGRPYLIKPKWAKIIAKAAEFTLPGKPEFPDGLIFSAELLGDFAKFPPREISARLHMMFGPSVIVYVKRDPAELLRSVYNQAVKNNRHYDSIEAFTDLQRKVFTKNAIGYFATIDMTLLAEAFSTHHEFRIVDFGLLRDSPGKFLSAFCTACDAPTPNIDLPHLNPS
jgi:hypothetical protein